MAGLPFGFLWPNLAFWNCFQEIKWFVHFCLFLAFSCFGKIGAKLLAKFGLFILLDLATLKYGPIYKKAREIISSSSSICLVITILIVDCLHLNKQKRNHGLKKCKITFHLVAKRNNIMCDIWKSKFTLVLNQWCQFC